MKLLIATDGFLPRWDGISSFLNELIPRLQDKHDITVVAPDLGELKHKYKARIIRFPILRVRLADNYYASIVKLRKLSREVRKADAVWIQCLGPIGVWSILLSRIWKKQVILYNHMIEWEVFPNSQGLDILKVPINVISKLFARILYNQCDIIIAPSIEQAELLSILGIRSLKKVVHLGVDTSHYKPATKSVAKHRLGIGPTTFVVGYGGRVSLEKDLITLYRAFKIFQKKNPDSVLLVAGGGRPELERMFTGKTNMILTGLQDDLAPYYQAMDVYVLPSLVETTSLTTMEAMSCGIPVVVTPVGFIKEYINDGTNGLLFPKKNSYALYRHLQYLKDEPIAADKLAKAGRETIHENYTWDKTAKGINEILVSIQDR